MKTFCNPVVLPNYPKLAILSKKPLGDIWNRAGKNIVDEFILMKEAGLPMEEIDPAILAESGSKEFTQCTENDVRATADPTVVQFQDRFYLYATSGMVYDSDDLCTWTPHYDETWAPLAAAMAPTVEEFCGKYYAAANRTPLHVSDSPLGPWKQLGDFRLPDGREVIFWDPMIFADADRLFIYFGLGISIMGAELDPDNPVQMITTPRVLIQFNPHHSWERHGAHNEDWRKGYIEGSYMNKLNGKYYLTY